MAHRGRMVDNSDITPKPVAPSLDSQIRERTMARFQVGAKHRLTKTSPPETLCQLSRDNFPSYLLHPHHFRSLINCVLFQANLYPCIWEAKPGAVRKAQRARHLAGSREKLPLTRYLRRLCEQLICADDFA